MSYDFTKIRETLKEATAYRKAVKAAFRLPHNSQAHEDARDALKHPYRNSDRDWATALYIAYAEARGKTHCDVKAWVAQQFWDKGREKAIASARELIVDRPLEVQEVAVGSA